MSSEKNTVQSETKEFQAEVKKMLDIVIHSLYTEKDIFLRELISNSADALEKFRHQSIMEQEVFDSQVPLEITIDLDEEKNTLTITDTGIGMDRGELEANLGTIAHSGSKTFFTKLNEKERQDVNLIGQFGVGFYAAFMVADKVRVKSRSYRMDDMGHEWVSDGAGTYTIAMCPGIRRGTSIILELKEQAKDYANEHTIKRIIKQYSNFVPFPIKVKDEAINTVQALWTRSKNEIKDEEYTDFYKFIGNAMDEPLAKLHFSAEAPLSIKALLFVPKDNFETMGLGRIDPGVSLYCRKVLIEQHSKTILPEWLRFLKGVIDSEDLPLNISRQALQDNSLVAKINKVVTKRFLKHLGELAQKEPETYVELWKTFGVFLKEGVISDFAYREELGKLLRFESSKTDSGKLTSLAEYVERMPAEQNDIYYINGPSREAIENGPYLEAFRKRNIEVIFTLDPIDDFAMSHLARFDEKKLLSADRGDLELPETEAAKEAAKEETPKEVMATEDSDSLTKWMKEALGERVKEVVASKRLTDSPAIVVNPDGFVTASMERLMRASGQDGLQPFGAKNLEVNTGHELIKGLAGLKEKDEALAKSVVEQIFDNAMIQAGLMVEPRTMVERTYKILSRLVQNQS
ncbi:MAG: molecular chaperone HtpG [Desulfobulbaceae bacterium]|nr:molecular chaperone HtpG [Desulfobulbaceae bacterium]HIJ78352.1 molecular chaperone HtpG [Deltaproteobacteria bacterium]